MCSVQVDLYVRLQRLQLQRAVGIVLEMNAMSMDEYERRELPVRQRHSVAWQTVLTQTLYQMCEFCYLPIVPGTTYHDGGCAQSMVEEQTRRRVVEGYASCPDTVQRSACSVTVNGFCKRPDCGHFAQDNGLCTCCTNIRDLWVVYIRAEYNPGEENFTTLVHQCTDYCIQGYNCHRPSPSKIALPLPSQGALLNTRKPFAVGDGTYRSDGWYDITDDSWRWWL